MTPVFGCVANTIKLRSGKYLDLKDPQPDQFDFEDIAGALAKICRFGAQCKQFYSVAEHSYHCSVIAGLDGCPVETQIAALMHDATEAFLGDCVKPLKIMLPEYAKLEASMEKVIGEKFGIDFWCESHLVREIDMAMLIAERREMFESDNVIWTGQNEVRKLSVDFQRWMPGESEFNFTIRARNLGIIG